MKRLTKKKKEEFVEKMSKQVQENNINIIVGFSGLSVLEMQKIRSGLKGKGCKMQVVKNTLLERIYKKIDCEDMCPKIGGPAFIVWTNTEDEIGILKEVYNFQKQLGKINVKAALIGKKIFSAEELSSIEKLPGKKEIEAKIVWILKMPARRIVNSLNFTLMRIIQDLKQISENKRKENENGKS
ncbi:MAG: 50S ribosomal protein L10 [bacterium]|nr:50S ribosomal protein L10 [bacterium]